MSEPEIKSEEGTKETYDFKKLSDEFSESLKKMNSGLESFKEDVKEQLKKPPKEETKDDFTSELFLDDEKKFEKIVDKKLNAEREKERNKNIYLDTCKEWDDKAYKEVPELNDQTISKLVLEEMSKMPIIGHDEQTKKKYFAPDALYNAAHIVKSKNPDLFKKVYEDLDSGPYVKTIKGVEMTEAQKDLSKLLGVSEDRAKVIYKDWNAKKAERLKKR